MIKNEPIKMRDGTTVKLGGLVYEVETRHLESHRYGSKRNPYRVKTGVIRNTIIESEIIQINQAANARTFTVRSPKGCENTYSVRNACLPENLFGKKSLAVKRLANLNRDDLDGIDRKLEDAHKNYLAWKACKAAFTKNLKEGKK